MAHFRILAILFFAIRRKPYIMINYYLFSLVALLISFQFPTALWAQSVENDSLEVTDTKLLNEIVVIGYDANRKLLETPGAVGVLSNQTIAAYGETSLVAPMNTLPGVRMEERAPGSYRIAIRGSALRAPFGVRNVKVYWNNIPFTEPSGLTYFNLLDLMNMEKVEVIKGPAGSIYGAGTGGALNINSMRGNEDKKEVKAGITLGSFGLQRYTAAINDFTEKRQLTVKYAHQEADGYREQSFFRRDVVEIGGVFNTSEKRKVSANLLYSDLNYGIPGGLTQEQFDEDPTQARPGNPFALGSVDANASIKQKSLLLGFTHEYKFSENFNNLTTIYGKLAFFNNPFNLDYKRDSQQSGGGRTRFYYDTNIGEVHTRFTFGGEVQIGTNVARNFENDFGQPGDLNFDDELRTHQAFAFANAAFDLPGDFYLTAGASYNYLKYDIYRLVDVALDSSYQVIKKFDPIVVPRIGLVKKFQNNIALHGSISYGFSPPTIEEVRTNEGSINLGLEPERGTNYEVGLRGNTLNGKLNFDLTAFYFQLDETIVQQESDRGTVLFTNTGNTDQKGIELAATWFVVDNPGQLIEQVEIQTAYTYHDFNFKNYVKEGEDFSGNQLTGVAPNISVTSVDVRTAFGGYFQGTFNFTDAIPLNDANDVYSDPYHLLALKAGYIVALSGNFEMEIFAGIDNVLNERYSLGNDLNAFGGRYFQPAAERNYFGGIKFRYDYSGIN